MSDESRSYLAYMLRLWRVEGEEEPAWRASLESPHTGERLGFGSLAALVAFLEDKTGEMACETHHQAQAGQVEEGGDP